MARNELEARRYPMLGEHPTIARLTAEADRVATLDLPVLITGETGTGKGLLARCIHAGSKRRRQPLVTVDCGSLCRELARVELFGARRGAYTGAVTDQRGFVAEAQNATLFLDEIGELDAGVQAQILRLLQEREYVALGETSSKSSNARVLAATNRDLTEEIGFGTFRSDLYYRLAVVVLRVPPLRERRSDIPLLAHHFIRSGSRVGVPECDLTSEAIEALGRHTWPGNVRELAHTVTRCMIRAAGQDIRRGDVEASIEGEVDGWAGPEPPTSQSFKVARRTWLDHFTREYLHKALIESSGNVSEAARRSGIGRQYFQLRMSEHGIRSRDYRSRAAER